MAEPSAPCLEEHYEELEFLWGQRRAALRSAAYSSAELARLEARVEAQVQGLLAAGEALPRFLRPKLLAPRPNLAFAAAYPLLRSGKEAEAVAVLDALLRTSGPARAGIGEALCQGTPDSLWPRLRDTFTRTPQATAAVALALAFRKPGEILTEVLVRGLLYAWAPEECRTGWRAAALRGEPLTDEVYQLGLGAEDPGVRDEALRGAAWTGRGEVLAHCRLLAARPAPADGTALQLLAILGTAADVDLLLGAGRNAALGSRRFEALGAFGHPAVVPALLEGMESREVRTAVAAGRAFARLTGFVVNCEQRVTLPPEDGHEPDAFEREFLEEVILPDPERARAYWEGVRRAFAGRTRWCRGLDLSGGASEDVLARLDRESFWEERLRAKFEGRWHGRLADLEVFPQPVC
jgi:uncharacterized protein (TIGR02270 family)